MVKNQPEKCPSFAQIELRNSQKAYSLKGNFVKSFMDMSKIWSKQSYIFVAVSHAFLIGSIHSITFLLNQILYANYFRVIIKNY